MRLCKRILVMLLLAAGACFSGCSVEDALRDGLTDGVSGALSAVIQAPIDYALAQTFSDP